MHFFFSVCFALCLDVFLFWSGFFPYFSLNIFLKKLLFSYPTFSAISQTDISVFKSMSAAAAHLFACKALEKVIPFIFFTSAPV